MKKILSSLLVLAIAVMSFATGFAYAETYVSARTTLSGASSAKKSNIALAAESINGTYVGHGESFSFNDTVGPRTKGYGYVSAVNGRGVKVTGGGVAQVATTLYLALLDVPGDDVEFGEIKTYGSRFTDNYVNDGDLAVITDYSAGTDFSFDNYGEDMYIEMWVNENYVYCSITLGSEISDGATGSSGWEWSSGWEGNWNADSSFGNTTSRVIASASIDPGDESGVLTNVENAANCICDITLNSREVFSFNDVVGPREEKYGYVGGTNGRGVRVIGGGVAQVASVIWLAVKDMDDIAIVEKSTYGKRYTENYVASSSDAILIDYNAGTDFSFRYTGDGSITIYTWMDNGILRCEIMGN